MHIQAHPPTSDGVCANAFSLAAKEKKRCE